MDSVVHLEARERGANSVQFGPDLVQALYEGHVDDEPCRALIELFEKFPDHTIALSTH